MNGFMRTLLLRANAAFLLLGGLGGLAMDLSGIFLDKGPVAPLVGALPASGIGFIEAHGLAVIAAVLLWRNAAAHARQWHATAAAIHVLLGGANLQFWDLVFVAYGLLAVGWVTTSGHVIFAALELVAWRRAHDAT